MAVSHAQKVATLNELQNGATSQKAVVLLNTGEVKVALDAAGTYNLRKAAKDQGVSLKVVKNTLIRLAFKESGMPDFSGSTFLAYLDEEHAAQSDEVTVPKVIASLVEKEFKDSTRILGSVVNGEFYNTEVTVKLSKTPTFTQSMSALAGLLQQIGGAKIAALVKEIPAQVCRGVSAYSKTLS